LSVRSHSPTRRQLLTGLSLTGYAALRPAAGIIARRAASTPGSAETLAGDETFWFEVQQAFSVDRSILNLNNGGVSPSPAAVQQALARDLAYANEAPAYTMWEVLEPQRESVRSQLATAFGCDAEEVAITRNASEGLQICQLGLDLSPGDEVLTTTHDYPRMIHTFRQRERREGIVLRQLSLPVPVEDTTEVVELFSRHVTERTRLILVSHMVNITGQILPVREIVELGRRRHVPVLVDGAHSFAHFPFRRDDLGCDLFATSLHKWLFAPFGTGMLSVRRSEIVRLWPLMAAPERLDHDIRKFEEIGTHPCPNFLAVAEALTFHHALGGERKAERLLYLRDHWARRLQQDPRVRLFTSLQPQRACGIATMGIDGIEPEDLARHLWQRHRILVAPIRREGVLGIRVSPSVYTTVDEVDRFSTAIEDVLARGIGA